jgi:signal transduction histidine kinase
MSATLNRTQRGETYAGYTDLEVMVCHECGVLHALPKKLLDRARKDPDLDWYCPNGHCAHFPGDSPEKRAERERERAERALRQADRLRAERDEMARREQAQRAAKTRIKNDRDRERKRIAHGVCPCCNRSFKNLKRHMESQHPDHAHIEA